MAHVRRKAIEKVAVGSLEREKSDAQGTKKDKQMSIYK